MNANQFTDPSGSRGPCVCRGLYRADVPTYENRHIARANILFSNQLNVRSLDHRIGCLDSSDKPLGLDHS
jgi:hypothetical protein